MKILVTEGMYKHTLGIVRALGKGKHRVSVLNVKDRLNYTKFSKYCSRNIIVPGFREEEVFIQSLLKILEREKFDLLIPVGFPVVRWVGKYSRDIKRFTNLVLPDYETQCLLEDKQSTQAVAKQCGIKVPETWYPQSAEEVERLAEKIEYPVVIKGVYEMGGSLVDYAYSPAELTEKYKRILSKFDFTNTKLPMLQKYLTGKARGFFALYDHGECVQHFMHERVREYPRTGGASSCAKSIFDETIFEYGKKILDSVKYHGVAMVEFKYDNHNTPYLLEVNPKFWGSFDLSVAAGVDFPNKLAKVSAGEPFRKMESYTKDIYFSWFFETDWRYGWETGQFLKFFFQLFKKNVRTNVTVTDIKPSLVILYFFFWQIRKRIYGKLFR